jgi:phage gpG-like protein
MTEKKEFTKEILTRLKVEIGNEWNRNFSRRAFFSKPWKARMTGDKGQLMDVSGALRGSIHAEILPSGVKWYSSIPYAKIQNEGGEITVTAKMKSFFWSQYYLHARQIVVPKGKREMSRRSKQATAQAEFWKAMALKRVGDKVCIPERRFMGPAPEVEEIVRREIGDVMKDVEKDLLLKFTMT